MSGYVEKILLKIAKCIQDDTYEDVETERLELKDLSTSDNWAELYKTVCAFLNTNGGIVVIGIKDKNNEKDKTKRRYKFTGFNADHEPKLKEISKKFTNSDGHFLKIDVQFPTPELREFQTGQIAVIYVEKLPDDQKFVYYDKHAYRRNFTGDQIITNAEIEAHQETQQELVNVQELRTVADAKLDLLNIDKLNQYIIRLNKGKTVETLKANLDTAKSFLVRKGFVRDEKPTLLGMLVCGDYVEDYIPGKCEVDCYVKSKMVVAQNKQVLKNNIIDLMENSIGFIYNNIQVGVSRKNGGTSLPEYPQELLEETVNNALAHRDYSSTRFTIIEITPDENVMIQNPGKFRAKQLLHLDTPEGKIRRIIPVQVARNPRLTDLLKSFDRWEGKGKGLASLTDACLENTIDLPYYVLSTDEIKLYIPKGKVFDGAMQAWMEGFLGYINLKFGRELNEEEKIVLSYFYKSEQQNRLNRYTIALTSDNNHTNTIVLLEEKGLLFKNTQSPDIYPIYLVDRTLLKQDFSDELQKIFGSEFNVLSQEYQKVLIMIYQYNKYGQYPKVSANAIGTMLYKKQSPFVTDTNDFESYKRKVRNIFNQLEAKGYIKRKNGIKPDFEINVNFKIETNLFSTEKIA